MLCCPFEHHIDKKNNMVKTTYIASEYKLHWTAYNCNIHFPLMFSPLLGKPTFA